MTWKEDTEMIADYCNQYAEVIGEFTVAMLQEQISEGNRVISRQNSITKAVKANLSAIESAWHFLPIRFKPRKETLNGANR